MSSPIRILLLLLTLSLPAAHAAPANAELMIEGRVGKVTVTLCEFRPRGCAGYFMLEALREGRLDRLMVKVRPGVPIRHGESYVLLANLPGSLVSVVYVLEKAAMVARSIEVIETDETH